MDWNTAAHEYAANCLFTMSDNWQFSTILFVLFDSAANKMRVTFATHNKQTIETTMWRIKWKFICNIFIAWAHCSGTKLVALFVASTLNSNYFRTKLLCNQVIFMKWLAKLNAHHEFILSINCDELNVPREITSWPHLSINLHRSQMNYGLTQFIVF